MMKKMDNLNEQLIDPHHNSSEKDHAQHVRESMKKETTLNEDVAKNYCLYFYLFCVLGLVNNTGYVMVGTAAHDLADLFNKKKLMPLFQFSEIIFGGFVKFVNSKFLINIKHVYRMTATSIIMLAAYVIIAAITIKAFEAGFWISLFCALLHGCAASLGESTLLGLLKGFPSRLVGAFSSGTGFAGVFGAGIFIVLKPFMSDGFIFLIVTPLVFVYFANTLIAIRKKNVHPFVEENEGAQERARSARKSLNDEEVFAETSPEALEGIDVGDDARDNVPMSLANVGMVFNKIGWYLSNLTAVYFLEYTCTTSFADIYSNRILEHARQEPDWDENNFFIKDAYVIFAFCYQFGVLLSRSSLDLIKIKRVGIITFLQFINFVFFFLNTQFFFLKNYFVMFAWMVFIGLMGGASYVNVMYLILNSNKLKKNEKELAVMTTCIF